MVTLCAACERDFRSAAKNPSQHRKHGSLTSCLARIGERASAGPPLNATDPMASRWWPYTLQRKG